MCALYAQKSINKLENILDLEFTNKELLQRSVTHKSFPNENPELEMKDNERLEFLGDSVLNLTITNYLFQHFPDYSEGKLAKMKAVLVSAPILAETAQKLDINQFLLLGKGEEMTGGRERDSILADAMEAIIGAIYLDLGQKIASEFILHHFKKDIETVEKGEHIKDYKTLLQETIQKNSPNRPKYQVVEEKGPDHNKIFVIKVQLKEETLGIGQGNSKKDAQQKAAKVALKNLGKL